MDKVIQKSLKSQILLTLNEINRDNNQLLLWLQKLNQGQLQNSHQLSEKLQTIKSDIKDRIKLLTTNFQQLYKIIDCKIVNIIRSLKESNVENQMKVASEKINTLQNQIRELQGKELMYKTQTQTLKNQNIHLMNELQQMALKVKDAQTDVSNKKINISKQKIQIHNDLTFNNPQNSSQHRDPPTKSIRKIKQYSEQNSFSSGLAYQIPQPTYGIQKKKESLRFGCFPNSQKQDHPYYDESAHKNNRSHRLQFLVTNLGDGHTSTSISRSNSNSHEKSVLSNGITRRYHHN